MNYILTHDFALGRIATWLLLSFIFAAMPWMSGPYWMAVIGVFLGACFVQVVWVFSRTVWLTFRRRSRKQM